MSPTKRAATEKEIKIHCRVPEHKNIVKLFSHGEGKLTLVHKFLPDKTSNVLWMELEYCHDGDLSCHLIEKNKGGLEEKMALDYLNQILDAAEVLHQAGIVHRDIKPENVFLKEGTLKLGDFGLSAIFEGKDSEELTET
jgi:serine/threonine protein kinase